MGVSLEHHGVYGGPLLGLISSPRATRPEPAVNQLTPDLGVSHFVSHSPSAGTQWQSEAEVFRDRTCGLHAGGGESEPTEAGSGE